jgi:hemin uptake protein HemP
MLTVQSPPAPLRSTVIGAAAPAPSTPKQVKSGALFDGAQELRIDHHGQEYRLRQTRNGKLILTK